jgi:hypothetical protein
MSETKKESWGAWKYETAKGEVINFELGGVKYSMWKNAYKTEQKHPDYKIYVNDYVKPVELQQEKTESDLPF